MENDNEQYFVLKNNRIIIAEHFRSDGKPLRIILENVILNAAKTDKNIQKH